MDGPSPALLFVVGGEEDDTVVVVTDAEDGWGGLMGRIDADMILSRGVFSSGRAMVDGRRGGCKFKVSMQRGVW